MAVQFSDSGAPHALVDFHTERDADREPRASVEISRSAQITAHGRTHGRPYGVSRGQSTERRSSDGWRRRGSRGRNASLGNEKARL